jgi:hypothetical protein
MSYGALRFLYDNKVTAAMITPDSQATGIVSGVDMTQGTGSATMYATGAFSGADDEIYIVQCDSITGGVSIEQATFRWKHAGDAAWAATGVTASATLTTLDNAVQVAFLAGTGNDFALYDKWQFTATATWRPQTLIDRDRDTVFRSGATKNLVINLGSAKQITAFALFDHNLVAGQTVLKLQGHTANSWGSPAYDSSNLTITDPLVLYLDKTYQYWRVVITDSGISYAEIAELFLGTYLELGVRHAVWGTPETIGYTMMGDASQSGTLRRFALTQQAALSLSFDQKLDNADMTALLTMQAALIDLDVTGRVLPMFVHFFSDEMASLKLYHWQNINAVQRNYTYVDQNTVTLELNEVVKNRV